MTTQDRMSIRSMLFSPLLWLGILYCFIISSHIVSAAQLQTWNNIDILKYNDLIEFNGKQNKFGGIYTLELNPNQSLTLLLNWGQALKLNPVNHQKISNESEKNEDKRQLIIETSIDGNVFKYASLTIDSSTKPYMINTGFTRTKVIQLKHGGSSDTSIHFQLFFLQDSPPEKLHMPIQYLQPATTVVRVKVKRGRDALEQEYFLLQANEPLAVHIDKPGTVKVVTQLDFRQRDTDGFGQYLINYNINEDSRTVKFATPLSTQAYWVGATALPLGLERQFRLTTNKQDAVLMLSSSATVLVKLIFFEDAKFLYAINEDLTYLETDIEQKIDLAVLWKLMNAGNFDALLNRLLFIVPTEQFRFIESVAQNNRVDFSKDFLVTLLETLQKNRPFDERYSLFRQAFLRQYATPYVLSPQLTQAQPVLSAYPVTQRIDAEQGKIESHFFAQHLKSRLRYLKPQQFYPLPVTSQVHVYPLLPHEGTWVRVWISDMESESEQAREVLVKLDQQSPLIYRLSTRGRGEIKTLPSPYLVALNWMRKEARDKNRLMMGSEFGRFDTTIPWVQAAQFYLYVPAGISQIQIWQNNQQLLSGGKIALAMYKVNKNSRLSVAMYHNVMTGLPELKRQFFPGIENLASTKTTRFDYMHQSKAMVLNDLVPAGDIIASLAEQFAADLINNRSVWLSTKISVRSIPKPPINDKTQPVYNTVQQYIQRIFTSNEQARLTAIDALINLLESYGDHAVIESVLKGLVVYSDVVTLSTFAAEKLAINYLGTQRYNKANRLFAFLYQRNKSSHNLAQLAQSMAQSGHRITATKLALLLNKGELRSADAFVANAYLFGWQRSFEDFSRLLSVADRKFWQGAKHLEQGQVNEALSAWQQASTRGKRYIKITEQAQKISSGLITNKQSDAASRSSSLVAWAQWQMQYPGPLYWRSSPSMVVKSHQHHYLYSQNNNVWSQYLMLDEQPAEIEVVGPVTLKIQTRLLVDAESKTAHSTHLKLQYATGSIASLSIAPRAFDATVLADNPGYKVSETYATEVKVPAGMQRIKLSVTGGRLLIKFFTRRPIIANTVLPWLSAESAATLQSISKSDRSCIKNCVTVYIDQSVERIANDLPTYRPEMGHQVDNKIFERLTPQFKLTNFKTLKPVVFLKNRTEAKQVLSEIFEFPSTLPLLTQVERFATILYNDKRHATLMPIVSELFKYATAEVVVVPSVIKKFTGDNAWQLIKTPKQNAGVFVALVRGWMPESERLQIRKALLDVNEPLAQLLSPGQSLVLIRKQTQSTKLHVKFRAKALPFVMFSPTQISIFQDKKLVKRIRLNQADEVVAVNIEMPRGHHQLRIEMQADKPRQYALVYPYEAGPNGLQPWVNEVSRQYQVATREEPIILQVDEPSLLRIIELAGEVQNQYYILVNKAGKTVTLKPSGRQKKALFRIHKIMHRPTVAIEKRYLASANASSLILPRSIFNSTLSSAHHPFLTESMFVASAYTWRVGGRVQRRLIYEDANNDQPFYDFAEISTSLYKANQGLSKYYSANALIRQPSKGGTLTKIGTSIFWANRNQSWLTLQSDIRVQYLPDDSNTVNKSVAWLAQARGSWYKFFRINPRWSHQPSVELFGRGLNLSVGDNVDLQKIDNDVYSRYKTQHRWGWRVAESLVFRPWLDAYFSAQAQLSSNENLYSVDRFLAVLSWNNFTRPFEWKLFYKNYVYFDDNDRAKTSSRSQIGAGLTWHKWLIGRESIELGFSVVHDFLLNEPAGYASLRWYFHRNQPYFDLSPRLTSLRQLKRQSAVQERKND